MGNIFAGIIGGSIFSFMFLYAEASLVFSLLSAVLSYSAGLMIFMKTNNKYFLRLKDHSRDGKYAEKVLDELREKIKELKQHSSVIQNKNVREKADGIIVTVEKIYSVFEKAPENISKARQFLIYYLESTVRILKGYVELKAENSNSAEIKNALEKAESVLDVIFQAFQMQHSRLLSHDVMDFKAEIEVLERTLKMESMDL